MTYTPGLWLFILASMIIGGLLVYSWQFRTKKTGQGFIFLMLCAFTWVILFTLETATTSLSGKLFFSNLEFLGITFLPVAWVFLVFAFTGQTIPTKIKILLFLLPTLTNIVIWTNPLHHWFMGNPQIRQVSAPFPVLYLDYQFWFYYIHAPAGYFLLLIAIFILVRSMLKMENIYQAQSRLLLLAILLPSFTDVMYVLGYSPVKYYNYTTAVFSLSGIILAWTLFHFRFLDLLPLARDTIIENLNDGIVVMDHKNRIVYVNPSARERFSISDKVIGQPIEEIQNAYLQKIKQLLHEKQPAMDIEIGKPPDKYFDLRISPVRNQHGVRIGSVATSRDITERTQLFNQVRELSIQDDLTGIFNRRHFMELCEREMLRVQRSERFSVSVVMIDLDTLKVVNDTYGHTFGDQVLIAFTQTMQSMLRKYDYFARLGGDEFGLLLLDSTPEEAAVIVERLRASVENLRVPAGDDIIKISASFGIVSSQQLEKADLDIKKMLPLADQALYQAKQAGRNRVMVYKD